MPILKPDINKRAKARALSQQGKSLREIGLVLGVSAQRVHQLLRGNWRGRQLLAGQEEVLGLLRSGGWLQDEPNP